MIKAKKSLGQNFLNDQLVLEEIINSCSIIPQDLIIEVGPGTGTLTKELKKFKANLIAFEVDRRLEPILLKLEDEKTKIIYQDILKANFDFIKDYKARKVFVVANIPYYITTPILKKFIENYSAIDSIILMVQKEVGQRLTAKPGTKNYGSLTVYVNYFYDTSLLSIVKKTCFKPVPKVDSAVIRLEKKEQLCQIDEKKFFNFVQECFKFKRKTLKNNLKNYSLILVNNFFQKYQLTDKIRAEEINLDLFKELYEQLGK